MKYMTKEWYNNCQKTALDLLLIEDKRASEFSEEYFQELYQQEKSNCNYVEDFEELFNSWIARLKENLPNEILKEVKDIRVLALNHASKEVVTKIKKYSQENKDFCKSSMENYDKIFDNQFKNDKPKFIENFGFHDCTILSVKNINNDIVLTLDNENTFVRINKIIFKDAHIIKQECALENAWWKYEEIYKDKSEYEMHALLMQNKGDLYDLIIKCSNIEYEK